MVVTLTMKFNLRMTQALFIRQLLWCFFALTLLIFSLGISWQANKAANFLYGFWYQTLQIASVIEQNVPKNTQGKDDFPIDDFALHKKMFTDIVQAIHQQGNGLADIHYPNSQTHMQALLTNSEVQHLQDVANLLDSVAMLWWTNLLILLCLLAIYTRKKKQLTVAITKTTTAELTVNAINEMPSGKQKLIAVAGFIVLVIAIMALWGFTTVFLLFTYRDFSS